VQQATLDLASAPGSGAGDGQPDTVIVNGSNATETVEIPGSGAGYTLVGLPAFVNVGDSEVANDQLVVNALAGNDVVSATSLPANMVRLTVDGGAGNDILTGSAGNDHLFGGDGDDILTRGPGADSFNGGPGTDSVTDLTVSQGDTQDGTIP
jgi:Ca2+-binding RTX toxin-like protein